MMKLKADECGRTQAEERRLRAAPSARKLDDFVWEAVYNDGTSDWECDPESVSDGTGSIINNYGAIKREKLVEFRLYSSRELVTPKIIVEIKPEYRLIWRKRKRQRLISGEQLPTIYLVGWQMTLNNVNIQSILYIYPGGTIELSDAKSDIELFDFER